MYFDRTVSPALVTALQPKQPFSMLAQLARDKYLTDLQLRGYPNHERCWATLYCGLTKVIDLSERDGNFSLRGVERHRTWDPQWAQPRALSAWKSEGPRLSEYLDRALREVADRYSKEGAVQAMLCTRAADLFSVIDRETVIGFNNTAEREATYKRIQDPLRATCQPNPARKWFVPKRFGGELDLLAVDPDGRLLAIEVKPGSATAGIAWAPLQVTFYAELIKAWSIEVGRQSQQILQAMLQQRIDLGLTPDPARPIKYPLEIVPVVAIGGRPKSPEALPRLRTVQDALVDASVGWPNLEIWQVEDAVKREFL